MNQNSIIDEVVARIAEIGDRGLFFYYFIHFIGQVVIRNAPRVIYFRKRLDMIHSRRKINERDERKERIREKKFINSVDDSFTGKCFVLMTQPGSIAVVFYSVA